VNKEDLLKRLEELKALPKRSLGQNFLVSDHVVEKILQSVKVKEDLNLLEIGPGVGALTEHLVKIPCSNFRVIELDEAFASYWRGRELEVIEADALQWGWGEAENQKSPTHLVSNLPYQISAPLVMELSSMGASWIQSMTLMFQKEVAERIVAVPKTKAYGTLSVVAQMRWNIKKVVDAGPACFHPRPKVSSRVLNFQWNPEGEGSLAFLKFVRSGFLNRRKFLMKSLKGISGGFDWEKALTEMGLSTQVRAEELKPGEWFELFRKFKGHGN
tara:strand:- start:1079 stop:1894 length:816 start_codon:yes stop_codon:yes gene_type:complete